MFSIRLDNEIDNRLSLLAKSTGRSKSYFVREAVAAYLDHNASIDFTPISVDVVKDQNLTLRAKEALFFTLERDDSGKLICCIKDDIGVFVYSETRDDLIKQLNAQILMLWREYALESDEKLSKSGQKLKKSLLEAFAAQ